MPERVNRNDVFGFVHPAVDAHTLGISALTQLLEDCGWKCVSGGSDICAAAQRPDEAANTAILDKWIKKHRITRLGYSYRLDPGDAASGFLRFYRHLKKSGLLIADGGPLRAVYFAGLPSACYEVRERFGRLVEVFLGDESPQETLSKLGIPDDCIPPQLAEEVAYDSARMKFGRELIESGEHEKVQAVNRSGYPEFGTRDDGLVQRLRHSFENSLPPLMRAHVGPYLANREQAVDLFFAWCRQLAQAGLLDILSVGTSQLTQSHFGQDWKGLPNGGGVPVNSPEEFRNIRNATWPMLVRTYAGTFNTPELALMYEETINSAWHALSFWWFCQTDGRGPLSLRENLRMHFETLKVIAAGGKPFEPNVEHHFSFRGADDVTYVVSGVLAARAAKAAGIHHLVLQTMLNTPKGTWGIQDLAKSRALLKLTREIEDGDFGIILQPRAGLDYFSPDMEKAKAQLAAVSAMMDDIEPLDPSSPPVVHVVSYCEGSRLADPPMVNDSVKITRAAIEKYREMKRNGLMDDMTAHAELDERTNELVHEARAVLSAIEASVPNPYTAEGFYRIFASGFLPVPYLWECRDEFPEAIRWNTRLIRGSMKVVDDNGLPISSEKRATECAAGVGLAPAERKGGMWSCVDL